MNETFVLLCRSNSSKCTWLAGEHCGFAETALGGGQQLPALGKFSSALGATQDSTSVLIRVALVGGSWLTYVCGN